MLRPGLPATEQEQADFFLRLRDGFELASARSGELARDFCVAGTSVRLRFAGEALTPRFSRGSLIPSMDWLGAFVSDLPLGFRVHRRSAAARTEAMAGFFEPRQYLGLRRLPLPFLLPWGTVSVDVMDRSLVRPFFGCPPTASARVGLASPLRSILHWWMELNGRQLVHAAAVGCGGAGVLMPGGEDPESHHRLVSAGRNGLYFRRLSRTGAGAGAARLSPIFDGQT